MSRTYTSRPPRTARAARHAWDYFERTRGKTRGIKELFYSRHYDRDAGAHWVCILNMRESDLNHWRFSESDLTWALPCHWLADQELPPKAHSQAGTSGANDQSREEQNQHLNGKEGA